SQLAPCRMAPREGGARRGDPAGDDRGHERARLRGRDWRRRLPGQAVRLAGSAGRGQPPAASHGTTRPRYAKRAMFELIKQLCELTGPSAQEGPVLDLVEGLWREVGARTERTRTGNLLGRVGERGPKVLLLAHADELCYLVRAI